MLNRKTVVITSTKSDRTLGLMLSAHVTELRHDTLAYVPIDELMKMFKDLSSDAFKRKFQRIDRFSFKGHPQIWIQHLIESSGYRILHKFAKPLSTDQIYFHKLSGHLPSVICETEERVAVYESLNIPAFSFTRIVPILDVFGMSMSTDIYIFPLQKGCVLEGNLQRMIGSAFRGIGKTFITYQTLLKDLKIKTCPAIKKVI
jgi:hypothetical protein